MQQPCEQDVELFMLLNPGIARGATFRRMAQSAVGWELTRRRAVTGDREAIAEYRAAQREVARIIAQAQAKVEAQLTMLHEHAKKGAPA